MVGTALRPDLAVAECCCTEGGRVNSHDSSEGRTNFGVMIEHCDLDVLTTLGLLGDVLKNNWTMSHRCLCSWWPYLIAVSYRSLSTAGA
jgi:hypothetical protein